MLDKGNLPNPLESTSSKQFTKAKIKEAFNVGNDISTKQITRDALISFASDILRNSDITYIDFEKDIKMASKEEVNNSQGNVSDFEGNTRDLLEFLKKFSKAYATFKKVGALKVLDAFIPEVNKDYTLKEFPFVVPLPVESMSARVDMQSLMNFMSDSYQALAPVVAGKITDQFKKRFPSIDEGTIDKVFITEAGFTYRLVEIKDEGAKVGLLEVMWSDTKNKYEDTDFHEEMNMSVFVKDFQLHDEG